MYNSSGKPRDNVAMASMHKARIISNQWFTKDEKNLSKKWLIKNGYKIPEVH
jgi:hypothetical protein